MSGMRDIILLKNAGLSILGAYVLNKVSGVEYISPVTIKTRPSLSDRGCE